MGIGVSGYSSDSISDKIYSKYSNTAVNTNMSSDESSSYLDFDGYLQLMTAQMSNQDFNNAMSDSEFIQQMSSYSMMEAISQLTKQNALSYTSSLIGKAVTVSDGSSSPDTGIVEAVTVTSDGCNILVNGNQYSADSITDVVDGEVYSMLNTFTGQTVEVKDGDSVITGKVMGVFIKNGNGYVTLDNKQTYGISAINTVVEPEGSDEDAENESSSDAETSEGTAQVSENAAAQTYSASQETNGVTTRSQEAFDTLMKMLDGNDVTEASITEKYASATVEAALNGYSVAEVEEVVASAGIASDVNVPAPSVYNKYYTQAAYTNSNNTQPYAASSNASYDTGDTAGVTQVSDVDASARNLDTYTESNGYYNNVPASTRLFADEYPLEAAFADSTGTSMADIRFIGNTDIMNVIDTSEIIAYSEKGKAVTDIGWCGKGRLGEVVTLADGTQRVEVIGPNGHNSYLYTSGNFTLSQMFDPSIDFHDKLTPFEVAIVHYAREYSAEEKEEMQAFEEYCRNHAGTLR